MSERQLSIYVQASQVAATAAMGATVWGTTVLGELRSTIQSHAFDWCWATKYRLDWSLDPTADGASQEFNCPGNHACFVKFRYSTDSASCFEAAVSAIASSRGWFVVSRDYDLASDLGSPRFLAVEQTTSPAATTNDRTRAEAIARFLHGGLLLALNRIARGVDHRNLAT